MRIPIWPGIRLSVWEKQNPEAVRVVTPFVTPYEPIRRVLSMRGWFGLLVRYDWKDRSRPDMPDPSRDRLVEALTKELHRRSTHLDLLTEDPEGRVPEGVVMNVRGEVLGLQAAVGIALGGTVQRGDADRLACEHYAAWRVERASEWSRCRCVSCERVLAGGCR